MLSRIVDRNRSKIQIIAEILGQLRMPKGKSNITSHCNMSTAQSGEYLNLMTSRNLIQKEVYAGRITYQKTEAGQEFLQLYKKIAILLEPRAFSPRLV